MTWCNCSRKWTTRGVRTCWIPDSTGLARHRGAAPEDSTKYDVYQSIEKTAALAVFVRAKLYRLRSGKEEWLDVSAHLQNPRHVKYNGFVSLVYEGWQDMDAMHAVPIGAKLLRDCLLSRE